MPTKRTKSVAGYYDARNIVDAPEYYEYCRAMGTLTWGTWDHGVRPVEERLKDFLVAYPPEDPIRFTPGGSLARQPDGTFAPGSPATRMQRFLAEDWQAGSLHEVLSRYGLKLSGGPAYQERSF